MNTRLQELLENRGENYIFPFFWQHGDDEATLRDYMRAISEANIGAVCLESRTHEDFAGPGWWHDVDIILEEAKKRNMKVWILDDKHFPTGYANGALENADASLHRLHLYYNSADMCGPVSDVTMDIKKYSKYTPNPFAGGAFRMPGEKPGRMFADDKLVAVLAAPLVEGDTFGECIDITDKIDEKGILRWSVPGGMWRVYVVYTTHNAGSRKNYIHMIDRKSCRVLIDAVYEPHYEHYADEFGKTIAGFFSDDISFYNLAGGFGAGDMNIGTEMPLPWSDEVQEKLAALFGGEWLKRLPQLWNKFTDADQTHRTRFTYMDTITRLVQENFSNQIGDWCTARGVEYVGHTIDENEFHSQIGMGLGHFFRCMDGQTMGGIDAIVGHVIPGGDNMYGNSRRDGEADHFTLAKLGSSHGHIDPIKKGRSMCEVFGAFGWGESLRTMKFITDHFAVNGINNFVPHAFTAKAYPDPDCPPHYYANGNDPTYRHFGKLMAYMNRVCHLISGGLHIAPVALLYHAESEWAGEYMATNKPARALHENQIDFDIIPADVMANPERFNMELCGSTLKINGETFRVLVIPSVERITASTAKFVAEANRSGLPVFFVDRLPTDICDVTPDEAKRLIFAISGSKVVSLANLASTLFQNGYYDIKSDSEFKRLRYMRYRHEQDSYYFANLDTAETFKGKVFLPTQGTPALYDPEYNALRPAAFQAVDGGVEVELDIPAYNAVFVVFDCNDWNLEPAPKAEGNAKELGGEWEVSVTRAIDYPNFGKKMKVNADNGFKGYNETDPDFSGLIAYEKNAELSGTKTLLVTDAYDCVEVFINGTSLGEKFCPPFLYDISKSVKDGMNNIRIEVATTLEREVAAMPADPNNPYAFFMRGSGLVAPTGMTGKVIVYEK